LLFGVFFVFVFVFFQIFGRAGVFLIASGGDLILKEILLDRREEFLCNWLEFVSRLRVSERERERCRVQYRAVLIAGGTLVTFPRGLETRDSREVVCVLGMQSSFCCRTLVLVL
jgi:hypothetical protein